jgi:coenzyme F420-dependent glucose-6-phosphate dehydrogenase
MRALWDGETVTTRGRVVTDAARLYSRPRIPLLLLGAAVSAETARWIGSWADGLITVAGARDDMRIVMDAFRESAGYAKPIFRQAALSFARTDEEATSAAHDQWRQGGVRSGLRRC